MCEPPSEKVYSNGGKTHKKSFQKRHLVDNVPISDLCDQYCFFNDFLYHGARWKLEAVFTEIKQKTKFRLPKP